MPNDVEQLNKIQLKAEILTTIKNLQTLQDASKIDEILHILDNQSDKKSILLRKYPNPIIIMLI